MRVSAVMGRGGDTFHSPETQEQACRGYVERVLGGVVPEGAVFVDLDVSGAVAPSDRPGLGRALELVRAGELEGVVVYDLSRWSRETASGLRELQEVAKLGAAVHSTAETIDLTTPGGTFATTVQLAAAQLRRDETARAWKATHAARFAQGKAHMSRAPLGYRRGRPQDGEAELVHDELLGPAIRQAFADYGAGTVSQTELARRLGALRGGHVWPATVSALLRSPFYVGRVSLNGEEREGRHEALVELEAWEAVQRRLERERFDASRKRDPLWALAGLAVCDSCGRALWRRAPSGARLKAGHATLLACRTKRTAPHLCAGIGTPRLDDLEQLVLVEVLEAARRLRDDAAELAARQGQQARAGLDAAKLRGELADAEAALGEAGVLLARKVLTELAYRATAGALEKSVAALREQLLAAEDRVAAAPPAALASASERLAELWPSMTPLEQKAALRPFVSQVRVRAAAYRGEPLAERVTVVPA